MNVLWFSNTPALGEEYLNRDSKINGTGGWMHSLNAIMQDRVNLTIAFNYPKLIKPFKYQNTQYFPVYTGNIIIENLKSRFLTKVYDDDFIGQYLDIINEVKPDIIHIHGTENSYLCILDKVKIPVVVSIQGNLTVISHKYNAGFLGKYLKLSNNKIDLKSFVFGRNSFGSTYKLLNRMALIESNRMVDIKYVIGRTDWDYRITRVLAPNSTYYEGQEMLRDHFYKRRWDNKFNNEKIILFTISGNSYYKGFETVAHALSLLIRLGIDIEWRVAGIGEDHLINTITKKYLKSNYPEKCLKLLGSLAQEDLISNMLESHIYVMPSHIENSPNNLCEAMILGMPCIAAYAGGTSSIINNNEEGLLIQDGDPWSLAGAILELVKHPLKAMEFGQKARARALIRHDKDNVAKSYVDIYHQILSKDIN